jgi:hypothetical protein
MHTTLLFLAGLFAIEPMQPQADALEGIYAVAGKENGADYTGAVVIRKFGDGYAVQISTALLEEGELAGMSHFNGVAMKRGDQLSFAWKMDKFVGLTVYTIGKNGVMAGQWMTFPGAGQLRSETLTRLGPLPKPQAEAKADAPARGHFIAAPLRLERARVAPPVPVLNGTWRCGSDEYQITLRPDGLIVIAGHPKSACGWIEGDRIILVWTWLNGACEPWQAIGEYRLANDQLIGRWGWEATIDDGQVFDATCPERLRRE